MIVGRRGVVILGWGMVGARTASSGSAWILRFRGVGVLGSVG